ncbi:MAG: MFS transporter [Chthoniobacterales bacterium]
MAAISPAATPDTILHHPPGFRARRGLNWAIIGLLYASFYMCRYNFRFATPGMVAEFGFSTLQITSMLSAWSLAYGTGQLVNGLLTDRIGGKTAMITGAIGTIIVNLIFGFSSFVGTFSTFSLIWLFNGYFQSFGAPGMIKINAAWFHRTERGTFAGIFGFMIQMGQFAINNFAPIILAGLTVGIWVLSPGPANGRATDWHYLFRIPPFIVAFAALLFVFFVKETPEAAGHPDAVKDDATPPGSRGNEGSETRASIRECFITIFQHPLIWFYALAYACTGAVRNSSDQLMILYFHDVLKLDLAAKPAAVAWTVNLMPLVAVLGSFLSGIVSDKVFKGHRSPVAMGLYFIEALVITAAAIVIHLHFVGPTPSGIFIGCMFLVLVSFTANSTHSIVGTSAAMDIGGRKMAGFASGVIDSFQYYGAAIALPLTGYCIQKYGWGIWYPIMAGFGCIGGLAMWSVMRKQKRLNLASA